MHFDLILRGGQLVTPRETVRADVGVRGGRIAAVGELAGASADETFDATGLFVLPGVIDEHVHSRDPGLTYKEDFAHSTRAAVAGGVTTVLEMPNSIPPVVDSASFHSRVRQLQAKARADFGLWGMLLGDRNLASIEEMARAGVVGYKLFWGYALDPRTLALVYHFRDGDDVILPPDEGQIYDAFRTVARTGRPVGVHAENRNVIARLAAREEASGAEDYAALLRSRPAFGEALTTQAAITLADAAGAHLHVLHISAGEAAEAVAAARARRRRVTGETCPHYLVLTDEDYPRAGTHMKIFPPVREKAHQDRLWAALQAGELQTVGSDHAPHTAEEKAENIWRAPAGAAGVQTLVPLMLDAASRGRITLNRVAAVLSENPARIFGLYPRKGTIAVGADADFTLVDMNREAVIRGPELLSKHPVTPFDGLHVQGVPVAAFIRGRLVMRDGHPLGEPEGELVRPVGEAAAYW